MNLNLYGYYTEGDFMVKKEDLLACTPVLASYFSDENKDLTLHIYKPEIQPDYECVSSGIALSLILRDVHSVHSFLFQKMSEKFSGTDLVQRKIDIFLFLAEQYFLSTSRDLFNRKDCRIFASSYYSFYSFKYVLPKSLLNKAVHADNPSCSVDLSCLSVEELAEYVFPFYYREIAADDREFLRENVEILDELSVSWFENACFGSLD